MYVRIPQVINYVSACVSIRVTPNYGSDYWLVAINLKGQ